MIHRTYLTVYIPAEQEEKQRQRTGFPWDSEGGEDVRFNIFQPNRRSEPRLAGSSYKPSVRSVKTQLFPSQPDAAQASGSGKRLLQIPQALVTRQEGEKDTNHRQI